MGGGPTASSLRWAAGGLLLGIRGLQEIRVTKNIIEVLMWLWIKRGMITPRWVTQERVSDDLRLERPRVHH